MIWFPAQPRRALTMKVTSATLALAFLFAGCSGSNVGPTAPSGTMASATGPRILLAGQSGAYFLQFHMSDVVTDANIDGNIDYWLTGSPTFTSLARSPLNTALVWYQGAGDAGRLTTEEYATKLRQVIAMVRVTNASLPIRIVEIADFPIRAPIREAQRQVAADQGVEMIPAAHLPIDPATNHLFPAGYQEIRDRIYRSLGR